MYIVEQSEPHNYLRHYCKSQVNLHRFSPMEIKKTLFSVVINFSSRYFDISEQAVFLSVP